MLDYKIEGGSLPVVICYPQAGQTICTQNGAMSWMSPNIEMETKGGGLGKMFSRMLSGESMFLSEYTAAGGSGMIAFASSFPGSIVPFEVSAGNSIIIQKKSFLAMEKGLELSMFFQKRLGAGFFGGEGFIMQKVSGNGIVFIEIDGYCKEYELRENETMLIDTGYLAAMTESCTMDVVPVKGAKNMFFGGDGVFHTKVTGPGKVYLQTMPSYALASAIMPYIPHGSND